MTDNEKGVLSQKYVDKARLIYNNLVNANSSDPRSCNEIISYCEKANKYLPHPDAYLLLSKAVHLKSLNFSDRERFDLLDLAMFYIEKALEILPKVDHPLGADFYFWKAEVYLDIVRFSPTKKSTLLILDIAEKAYREALRLDPNHPLSINNLNALIRTKRKLGL